MNKELREILAKINAKKEEGKKLVYDGKLEDAEKLSEEVTKLQKQFDILMKLEEDDNKDILAKFEGGILPTVNPQPNAKQELTNELFCKAIIDTNLRGRGKKGIDFTNEERAAITEHVGEDGGLAVPKDISVKINRRLQDRPDISTLVKLEQVYTRNGSRTFEKRTKQTPLGKLTEYNSTTGQYGRIEDTDTPKLEELKFNLKDLAGMITIPNDILQFADKELENFIIEWLVDKVRVTRNEAILNGYEGIPGILESGSGFEEVGLPDSPTLKEFKKLRNVTLKNVFKKTSCWVVNQDGFNYLDSLEDKQGRSYLQPDPKDDTQYRFLGSPVIEIGNETLESVVDTEDAGKLSVPIILGDLEEAYTLFFDNNYTLATTNTGAGSFETNTTKTRVIAKLDGAVRDKEAIIIAKLPLKEEEV